jgi:hypothetical protein
VISFGGMENAEGEAPTELVCVKQNEEKPSCAEDTNNRQNPRMVACSVARAAGRRRGISEIAAKCG